MAEYEGRKGIAQIFSGLNLLVGLWLIFAPWLLGYDRHDSAVWNNVFVGVAVLLLAAIRVIWPARLQLLSRINMALGLWLVLAPFVLQYGTGTLMHNVAFWNDVFFGIVIFIAAWLSAETTRRMRILGKN